MNDCVVTYIEKYIFKIIKCEEIMQRFLMILEKRLTSDSSTMSRLDL